VPSVDPYLGTAYLADIVLGIGFRRSTVRIYEQGSPTTGRSSSPPRSLWRFLRASSSRKNFTGYQPRPLLLLQYQFSCSNPSCPPGPSSSPSSSATSCGERWSHSIHQQWLRSSSKTLHSSPTTRIHSSRPRSHRWDPYSRSRSEAEARAQDLCHNERPLLRSLILVRIVCYPSCEKGSECGRSSSRPRKSTKGHRPQPTAPPNLGQGSPRTGVPCSRARSIQTPCG